MMENAKKTNGSTKKNCTKTERLPKKTPPAAELSATRKLVECAAMIAMATVLNLIKLMELPNGGEITCASMLPIILVAYRFGFSWGLGTAAAYALIQQIFGLKNLSYVFGWYSVAAVILLDYFLAYTVLGFASVTRGKLGSQARELAVSTTIVCIFRYLCHLLSGAVVWSEFVNGYYKVAIPTLAAWLYSAGYNAVYMIPETIVTAVAAAYVGGVIDFSAREPRRLAIGGKKESGRVFLYRAIGGLFGAATILFDTFSVFAILRTDEAGRFDFSSLASLRILPFALVTAVGTCAVIVFLLLAKRAQRKA